MDLRYSESISSAIQIPFQAYPLLLHKELTHQPSYLSFWNLMNLQPIEKFMEVMVSCFQDSKNRCNLFKYLNEILICSMLHVQYIIIYM